MTDRRLGDAVRPELSEARLARQWDAIRNRIRPAGSRARWWLPVAAAAALAVVALIAHRTIVAPAQSPWDGAIVESALQPVTVTLKDGSRISLQRQSRLELVERKPESVQFRLRSGQVHFDVPKSPERRLSVMAEDVVVRVVGTRFSVRLEPAGEGTRVSVVVERGTVEVAAHDETIRLSAGDSWSTVTGEPAEEARRGEPAPAVQVDESAARPAEPEPATAQPARATARELFEAANRARLEGDTTTAVEKYRALLSTHPADPRAGLAAFELGRLLQDRLGDSAGAARALNRAIRLTSGSGFKEDAMARLVRAYATMGATGECERARQAYLQSYPSGVHATAVRRACR